MKTTSLTLTLAAALTWLAVGLPAAAQEKANPIFIYARYFHCNNGILDHADDAVRKLHKPALEEMIKQKAVDSWGWLGRNTGGEWARAGYLTGQSVKAVLAAADTLEIKSDHHPPQITFDQACSSSEDYIWHVLAGNDARGHRGIAAFSTYYVCDQTREKQADALVKQVLGPVYDKLVANDDLTTWAWAEHIVGGKYRRLATMTARSMDALIAVREKLVAAAEHEPLDEALTSICGSHQDYIWNVKDQGPDRSLVSAR